MEMTGVTGRTERRPKLRRIPETKTVPEYFNFGKIEKTLADMQLSDIPVIVKVGENNFRTSTRRASGKHLSQTGPPKVEVNGM